MKANMMRAVRTAAVLAILPFSTFALTVSAAAQSHAPARVHTQTVRDRTPRVHDHTSRVHLFMVSSHA